MLNPGQGSMGPSDPGRSDRPILVCLLGTFRLLKVDQPVTMHGSRKTEALLVTLAVRPGYRAPRETLLSTLWPDSETVLSGQSLNSLVYGLRKLLGDAIGGAAPVLHDDGHYRLNVEAGVGLDVAWFDDLVNAGDQQIREGNAAAAVELYRRAITLYGGDLCANPDVQSLVERERLRAVYLSLLARVADYCYAHGDYAGCLQHALHLLGHDPCREDAHRLAMRCYMQRAERAAALRQYRLCERILRDEFDAVPEPATVALYDRVRLYPGAV